MDVVRELYVRWAYYVVRCAYNPFAQYAKRTEEVRWRTLSGGLGPLWTSDL